MILAGFPEILPVFFVVVRCFGFLGNCDPYRILSEGGGQVHRGDSCRTNPGKDPERAANDFAVRCSGDALKILREHSLGSSTRTRNACCISRRIDISLRKDPDDFLGGVGAETLEPFFEIL